MDSRSPLFSVRMRASAGAPHEAGGRHVSGAERLVRAEELETATLELLRRARERDLPGEHIRISVDQVPFDQVHTCRCLDVTTLAERDPCASIARATEGLVRAEICEPAISAGFALLQRGPDAGGTPLRGAALLHARTGERLDPDASRGVRASRFDYAPEVRPRVREALDRAGLGHFRTCEALAVATKVLWSGVAAELCWSDEPDYVAGYVATAREGYVRFPNFKPPGATGGRVFFVRDPKETEKLIQRLQQECLLISTVPKIEWTQPAERRLFAPASKPDGRLPGVAE